jgi:hypothetical protein
MAPVVASAHVCAGPVETAVNDNGELIGAGVLRLVVVLSPSSPAPFGPQQMTVPEEMAHVCPLVLNPVTVWSPIGFPGMDRAGRTPSSPQHHTLPSVAMPQLDSYPKPLATEARETCSTVVIVGLAPVAVD